MGTHYASNRIRHTCIGFLISGFLMVSAQAATSTGSETEDLIDLSLEELLQVTVTSVSRKPQSLTKSPAAVFVVSQDDIRRSGARTIPDALRMVPGVQVAQVDASTWAVTARGSNGTFANKLLVLMDGRTVYDPLFSGTYWDVQDTTLASIDRIEVIRGPGAALWGANAVNGVINIITTDTSDTQGLSAAVTTSTSSKIETNIQWGGTLGQDASYRMFGKYFKRDGEAAKQNGEAYDDWKMGRIGARLDWATSEADTITVTSEYYDGDSGQNVLRNSLTPPSSTSVNIDRRANGGFINLGWNHDFSETSNLAIKTYYDHREISQLAPESKLDIIDLDLQHHFRLGTRHDVVWGFGLRNSSDKTVGDDTIVLTPADRTQRLYSGFVQDEIRLVGDELFLTLGTKVEKNNFSPANEAEWSPNLRLSWLISDTSTLWGSVARAIRTPSRVERDGVILGVVDLAFSPTNPQPFPFALTIEGNPAFDDEKVLAYELGYRVQPLESLTVDFALFFNDYDDLRLTDQQPVICQPAGLPISNPGCFAPGATLYVNLPISYTNAENQETKGVEVAVTVNATEWWRIYGAYSFLKVSGNNSALQPSSVGEDSPEHQLSLRSNMNIGETMSLDIWARYIDDLEIQQVDSYVGLDVRFAWQALSWLELSLAGRNLIESNHLEFREEFGSNTAVEIDREVYGELLWKF